MAVDVRATYRQTEPTGAVHEIRDVRETTCCIVGAGPAGALLALLLARRGIPVTLLEAHADLDRDFRGDTVHPAIMEILAEIGLADRVLELPHTKIHKVRPPGANFEMEFARLKTRFPFIVMLPQVRFLEFLTAEAARYPAFRLVMGANVRDLVQEKGVIRGVRYQAEDGWHGIRALLTVGADGRFSRLRHLSGLHAPRRTSQPIDILWFRVSRKPTDPEGFQGRLEGGMGLVMLDRGEQWQIGYLLPKGGYRTVHDAGLVQLRQRLASLVPWLADRVDELRDWKQFSLLSVESDFMPRWYRPGLLLIGDAAHVMSPVGGNGINYAVQDAVAAFNVLAEPLRAGRVTTRHLAAVQRRRALPTRITQAVVNQIQDRVLAPALRARGPVFLPAAVRLMVRMPVLRDLPLRWVAFGVWPVHVKPLLREAISERVR
jgi:2-polyprenyl-6-methoxyphenol hydroxylase-like FAD-dependent oxidoreductase